MPICVHLDVAAPGSRWRVLCELTGSDIRKVLEPPQLAETLFSGNVA